MAKKYAYEKYITIDGRRYAIRADSEKELILKEAAKRKAVEDGEPKIKKNMLVRAWAKEWMETYKAGSVSQETYGVYESVFRCHILPYIGHMQLRAVRPIHIQKMLNQLHGKSAKLINRTRQLTSEMMEAALTNELLLHNPCEHVVPPKGTKTGRRALTDTERRYILELCETHRGGLWIKLMLYCGLRPAEAAALQWRHIDLKTRTLTVEQALKGKGGVGAPKSAAGIRKVPIPLAFDIRKPKDAGPFDWVLTNTRGDRFTISALRKLWIRFKNDLNILMGCESIKGIAAPPYRVSDDLVPYVLRHTYCTDLQDAGVPINIAKELMGHADIATTSRIYTHRSDISLNKARDLIDSCNANCNTPAETLANSRF